MRRYSRHLILPDVGVKGQRRLKASSVLAVGTGGLGSPALLYLAAAGVGRLGIVDDDVVDESNLQRQVMRERVIGLFAISSSGDFDFARWSRQGLPVGVQDMLFCQSDFTPGVSNTAAVVNSRRQVGFLKVPEARSGALYCRMAGWCSPKAL